MKPTHIVVDRIYHEDEPEFYAFSGSLIECNNFIEEQGGIGYEIRINV